jgi:D-serine deaminase-like pyridoxal phosphate-dependent protein
VTWTIDDLDTPAVLIDLGKVEANLTRAQAYADRHGLALRPHVKTHKIPELARARWRSARSGSPARSSARPR